MRVYKIKTSNKIVASATTIIGAMINKPILMKWACKEAGNWLYDHTQDQDTYSNREIWKMITPMKKASDNIAKKSMIIGTKTHKLIEDFLTKNKKPDFTDQPPEVKKCFLAFFRWFKKYSPEVLGCEVHLYNDDNVYGYAGTTDLICKIDGKEMMIDFKTSNHLFEPDYPLQLALYKNTDDDVEGIAALRLDKKTGQYEYKDYSDNYKSYRDAALSLVKAFNILNKDEIKNGRIYKEI